MPPARAGGDPTGFGARSGGPVGGYDDVPRGWPADPGPGGRRGAGGGAVNGSPAGMNGHSGRRPPERDMPGRGMPDRGMPERGVADRRAPDRTAPPTRAGRAGSGRGRPDRGAGPADYRGTAGRTDRGTRTGISDRGGRGGAGRGRSGAADTDSTTRIRAVHGDRDRTGGAAGPPKINALYDTVDQAALRRIDVRERTADATVYHKVVPSDTEDTGLDTLDRGRPPRRGVAGRRPAGPDSPGGPDRRRPGEQARDRGGPRPGQGRRGPKWWRNRPLWFRRLVLIGMLSSALLFIAGIAVVYAALKVPLPGEVETDQSSILYWADGSEMDRIGEVNRTDVPLSQVSKDVQHAVLAAENKNFYNEPGISPRGIARALWVNITGGEISQGGSTITQQYVKNAYLTQERTFSRKMKEIVLAVKLDQKYSKDQILEFYLNTIYFGRQAYGIEAAARAYFGKSAAELNAAEGAVIAGLIRSPNNLDPAKNPEAARARWRDVVNTMIAEGWAPPELANQEPPPVLPREATTARSDQLAYIREQVKRELAAKGITEEQIDRGGLRITTTLDRNRQQAAYDAVTSQLSDAYAAVPDLRTGLVAIQPGTGKVLAWYGGSLYGKGANGQEQYQDNVSQALLPPGSTFKTVTLVAALESGINLRSTYEAPAEKEVAGYVVHNDESEPGHLGWPDLIEATAESINTVYVPLGYEVGVDKVIETAYRMGVDESTHLERVAGVSLGKDGVTAVDMVEIYGTLASGGYRATPYLVEKVENGDGDVIYQGGDADETPVIPQSVARDATYALQKVIEEGTGKNARLEGGRPAAGKTGTTDDFRSAWFCGYTREIASCVNMFRGKGEESDQLKGIPGAERGVYGGNYPAKIWKAFMDAALKGVEPKPFDPPAFVGVVTKRSPAPPPSPTETPSPTPTSGGLFGDDDWDIDIFRDDDDNGRRNDNPGQPQRPQRPTRPTRTEDGGIHIDIG